MKQRLRELSWTVSPLPVFLYKMSQHFGTESSFRRQEDRMCRNSYFFGSLHRLFSCPGHISYTFMAFGRVQESVFKHYTEVFIYFVSLAILVSPVSLSSIISSALNRKTVYIKSASFLSCGVCNGSGYGLFIFSSFVIH